MEQSKFIVSPLLLYYLRTNNGFLMSVRQCLVHRYRSVRNRRVAHTLFNLFIHRSSVLAYRLKSFLCPVKTFGLLRCGSATAKVRNGKLLFAMPAYKHTHTVQLGVLRCLVRVQPNVLAFIAGLLCRSDSTRTCGAHWSVSIASRCRQAVAAASGLHWHWHMISEQWATRARFAIHLRAQHNVAHSIHWCSHSTKNLRSGKK